MTRTFAAALLGVALVAAACSGTTEPVQSWTTGPTASLGAASPSALPASQPPATPPVTPGASEPGGDTTQLTIGTDTGTELVFDPTTATVPTGATVELTFENRSTLPHNLTFEAPIATATNTVVNGGASETIEFTAPEPGDYPFVCTLHAGMEGTLTVE